MDFKTQISNLITKQQQEIVDLENRLDQQLLGFKSTLRTEGRLLCSRSERLTETSLDLTTATAKLRILIDTNSIFQNLVNSDKDNDDTHIIAEMLDYFQSIIGFAVEHPTSSNLGGNAHFQIQAKAELEMAKQLLQDFNMLFVVDLG